MLQKIVSIKKRFCVSLLLSGLYAPLWHAEQVEHTLDIPVLGQARLTGELDILNNEYSLQGELIGELLKLDLGPLSIDKPTVALSNTKGLSVTARGTLFNKSIEIGVQELKSTKRIVLGATFVEKPTITVLPGKPFTLDSVSIAIERPEGGIKPSISFSAKTILFNQEVNLTFGIDDIQPLDVTVKNIAFADLIDTVKGTPLESIIVKEATIKIKNVISALRGQTQASDIDVELSGTVDFTPLGMTDINQDVSSLSMKAIFNKEKGFEFGANLQADVKIPFLGVLKGGMFEVKIPYEKKKEEKVKLMLAGRVESVEIPTVGTVDLSVSAALEGKFFDFEAKLNKDVTIGEVTLGNPYLKLVRDEKLKIVVSGDATLKGYQVIAKADLDFGPKEGKSSLPINPEKVSISGKLKAQEPLRPFKDIKIPDLPQADQLFVDALALREASIMLDLALGDQKEAGLSFSGQADIFNLPLEAQVSFIQSEGQKGVVVKAGLPREWKISDSIKGFTALDKVPFKNPYIYISSLDKYTDPTSKQAISKGISLFSGIEAKGILENLKKIPVVNFEELGIYGTFSADPTQIKVGANLPNLIKTENKFFRGIGVRFEISGEPSIAFKLNIAVRPPGQEEDLVFTGEVKPEAMEAEVSLSMQGFWEQPFGIPGLAIGNLALEIAANYAQICSTGLPSGIGMTGSVKLGVEDRAKTMMIAANITESADIMFAGKLDGPFATRDIIDYYKSIALTAARHTLRTDKLRAKINQIESDFNALLNKKGIKDVLEIGVRDIELKIVPTTTAIGQITFQRGITIAGGFDFLGQTGKVYYNISETGIKAEGYLSKIDIGKGIFKLDGVGQDGKKGTQDDGPIVKISLNLSELPQYLVSGNVEFLRMASRDILINLSKDGFEFTIEGKINNIHEAKITCKSKGGFKNPDFTFEGSLKSDFKDFVRNKIRKILENRIKNAKLKIVQKISQKILDFIKDKKPIFDIKKAHIRGSLQELVRGKLPYIDFTVKVLDKTIDFSAQFDFKDIEGSALSILKQAFESAPGFPGVKTLLGMVEKELDKRDDKTREIEQATQEQVEEFEKITQQQKKGEISKEEAKKAFDTSSAKLNKRIEAIKKKYK